MKVLFSLIIYIFLSLFSNCFAKIFEIDKILAIVNNQVILNSDLNQILFYLKETKNISTVPFKTSFLKDKILEKLIIDTLMLEEANKFNIIVSDDQVDNILKNIAFKKHMTFDEFKKNIILNNTNDFFNYADYINNIKNSLKIQIFQDYILHNNVHVTDKEVYYFLNKKINNLKTVSLKFIILPILKNENNQIIQNKKKIINNFFKKINNYSDFDYFYQNIKKNKSIFLSDTISLKPLKTVRKLFSKQLNISKENEILGPILGKKGFYIIKVENIQHNIKKKLITEFHIQDCLIRTSSMLNDIQAKKYIFEIYNNIKRKHYSFDYAIKHLSHNVNSIYKKGDLGWISNESLNNDLKNILNNLNNNEISKPIKFNYGWHIIKLLEKRQIDQTWKLEKEKIYHILLEKKIKKEKINWINKLKKLSYINIFKY